MQTTSDLPARDPVPAWLKSLLEPLKPLFKEVPAGSFFLNLLAIAMPVFVLQVYDRVIFHAGFSTLQGLVIGILVVIGFDFALPKARLEAEAGGKAYVAPAEIAACQEGFNATRAVREGQVVQRQRDVGETNARLTAAENSLTLARDLPRPSERRTDRHEIGDVGPGEAGSEVEIGSLSRTLTC